MKSNSELNNELYHRGFVVYPVLEVRWYMQSTKDTQDTRSLGAASLRDALNEAKKATLTRTKPA